MIGRRMPKARRFSYEPHYYDPKKDDKTRKKIKFQRQVTRRSAKSRSIVWLVILIALVVYLVVYFSRLVSNGGA